MSIVMHRLSLELAAEGERSLALAGAICGLVVEGGKLGELETVEVRDSSQPSGGRECRRMPEAWLHRLLRAVEVGAFERMPAKTIVERILTTPEAIEKS